MNAEKFSIGLGAILVSYIVFMLPVVSATDINIMFNGQPQRSASISPDNLINMQVNIDHDPSDVSWSNVKVQISLSSATLAKSISKIYLYRCKDSNPTDCALGEPLVFESYIDTELAWKDMSTKTHGQLYPEEGNLLILVKLENGRDTWTGFWKRIVRTDYNVFNVYGDELPEVDVELESLSLLNAMVTFIDNYQMIPFNWAKSVTFRGAGTLFSIGGDSNEIERSVPAWQTARPGTNTVTSIAKEYFFVLPEIGGEIGYPIVLNDNPGFSCGNGICEFDLGETQDLCCYDCGCPDGQYCGLSGTGDPMSGFCRQEALMALQVSHTSVQLTDCSTDMTANVVMQITNPPAGIPDELTATFILNGTPYSVACTGAAGSYSCPITMTPSVGCGSGVYSVTGRASVTLTYTDGPETVTRELVHSNFPPITVSYDCECGEGKYCDSDTHKCESMGNIGLSILNVTSHLSDYETGDMVYLHAKITNPPTGLMVTNFEYRFGNITWEGSITQGESGSPACEPLSGLDYTYKCSMPLTIHQYNHEHRYVIRNNLMKFHVSFPSGGQTFIKVLEAAFSDIMIPSYTCGDKNCDSPDEDQDNCCLDCGCPIAEQFCDLEKGCLLKGSIGLETIQVHPTTFKDCREEHTVYITTKIENVPSDAGLVSYYFIENGQRSGWVLDCFQPNTLTGTTECELVIPPQNGACQASGEPYLITNNELEMTVSFSDGPGSDTKTINTKIPAFTINSTYICGDGKCEYSQNENATNCCVDCLAECEAMYGGEGYCDSHIIDNPDGTCLNKGAIELVVTSPVGGKTFDTCEKTNNLNVKAYIRNSPSDMRVESYWAEIDGSGTSSIICRQERLLYEGANLSYNCSISIPSIFNCTQGSRFVYDRSNNSLYFFVSYANGRQARELSDSIATITITQDKRSMHDIMQNIQTKMMDHLDKIRSLANRLKDKIDDCLDMMKIALLVMLVVGVMGGIFSAKAGGTKGFGEFMKGWGQASKGMFDGIKTYCDLISKYYDTQFKLEDAEFNLLEMELCIDLYQHRIDNKLCARNEMSCFNDMKNCVNQGRQAMGQATTAASQAFSAMATAGGNMGSSLNDIGEGISDMYGAVWPTKRNRTGDVRFWWGPGSNVKKENTGKVCGYSQTSGQWSTTWMETNYRLVYQSSGDYACHSSKVYYQIGKDGDGSGGYGDYYHISDGHGSTNSLFDSEQKMMKIRYFCKHAEDDFKSLGGGEMKICYCKGTQYQGCNNEEGDDAWECAEEWGKCTDQQAPSAGSTGTSAAGAPPAGVTKPNLIVSKVEVVGADKDKIAWTVENDGNKAIPAGTSFRIAMQMNGGDWVDIKTHSAGLGIKVPISETVDIPPALMAALKVGSNTITVMADHGNAILESEEGDNTGYDIKRIVVSNLYQFVNLRLTTAKVGETVIVDYGVTYTTADGPKYPFKLVLYLLDSSDTAVVTEEQLFTKTSGNQLGDIPNSPKMFIKNFVMDSPGTYKLMVAVVGQSYPGDGTDGKQELIESFLETDATFANNGYGLAGDKTIEWTA